VKVEIEITKQQRERLLHEYAVGRIRPKGGVGIATLLAYKCVAAIEKGRDNEKGKER
jgi:hypothetical protein